MHKGRGIPGTKRIVYWHKLRFVTGGNNSHRRIHAVCRVGYVDEASTNYTPEIRTRIAAQQQHFYSMIAAAMRTGSHCKQQEELCEATHKLHRAVRHAPTLKPIYNGKKVLTRRSWQESWRTWKTDASCLPWPLPSCKWLRGQRRLTRRAQMCACRDAQASTDSSRQTAQRRLQTRSGLLT